VDGHYIALDKRLNVFPSQESLPPPDKYGSRVEDKVISLEAFSSTGRFRNNP